MALDVPCAARAPAEPCGPVTRWRIESMIALAAVAAGIRLGQKTRSSVRVLVTGEREHAAPDVLVTDDVGVRTIATGGREVRRRPDPLMGRLESR
jgi:hypothetical protein